MSAAGTVTQQDKTASARPPAEYYDHEDSDNVCFLCGDPKYTPTHETSSFGFSITFQRCQCGLEKQTPMPNEAFFEWFFNSDLFFSSKQTKTQKIWGFYDYFKDEPCRLATSKYRYKKLSRILDLDTPKNILKIGPSTGTFLHVANQHGHNAIGCDVSREFVDYARKNYDVRIDNGRFEHLPYKDEQFDIIVLFNVVENIPNQDEFFRAVNARLKPGGHFVLNYVEMRHNLIAALQGSKYFIYRPPICYSYTAPVMNRLLNAYGFEAAKKFRDIRYLHAEKIFSLLDWPNALRLAKALHVEQKVFRIYAYPSRIVVAQKQRAL